MKGLDDLYLFQQVVMHGGISAAATQLGIPKSTLTRRITTLENQLRNRLFHRGPRKLVLTNFGRDCYSQSLRMAHEADVIFEMAERMADTPAGSLHVVCPPLIGQMALEAIALEFAANTPEVKLHLEETNDTQDPRRLTADLVFHASFEPLSNIDVVAKKILTIPYILVCTPDVVRHFGMPQNPDELEKFNSIGFGPKTTLWAWRLKRGRERTTIPFIPKLSTTQLLSVLRATLKGLGVSALPKPICAELIEQKKLIHLLPEWNPDPIHFFAIYPSSRTLTRAAREFLERVETRLPTMIKTHLTLRHDSLFG